MGDFLYEWGTWIAMALLIIAIIMLIVCVFVDDLSARAGTGMTAFFLFIAAIGLVWRNFNNCDKERAMRYTIQTTPAPASQQALSVPQQAPPAPVVNA